MLFDLVLYYGPLVGAVDGVGVGFLMQFRVHDTMGSYSVVFSLFVMGVRLVKAFCTLGDGVVITGTLIYEGMSNSICGSGIGGGFGNLGDVCAFLSSGVCVKIVVIQWGLFCWKLGHGVLVQ